MEYECASLTTRYFPNVVTRFMVPQLFQKKTNFHISLMLTVLNTAFSNRISKMDWLDESTRKSVLYKLDQMGSNIGYSDEVKKAVNVKKEAQILMSENHFYKNLQVLRQRAFDNYVDIFLKPSFLSGIKGDWRLAGSALTANAFYAIYSHGIL
jgi:predicted metalloendopeptidase